MSTRHASVDEDEDAVYRNRGEFLMVPGGGVEPPRY